MSKEESEKQINKLVDKYKNLTQVDRKHYNEANTRKNFILPLFEALGWDVRSEDVSEEERASGKRVDYAFKINGITKFFLEAKSLGADLDESRWAEQAIWYAYHKSVPWVILTNFEKLKVFNAEWDSPEPETSLFFELKYDEYLNNLDKLLLLSKELVENGELDKKALEWGKKPKTVSTIGERLIEDLLTWRDNLFNDLIGYNSNINKEKAADSVQKFLNRLIFIRTCEDRGFEQKRLREILRGWEDGGHKNEDLIKRIQNLFLEFDRNYDSKLFEDKILFDVGGGKLIFEENTIAKVIEETYKNSRGIRWNFNDINADVLGSVYEQYLGKIQSVKAGREEKKSAKRKSQGIYYTPRYIVDYIVKNTLGEILKNKPAYEASRIKILDPACGSGSFLIKAFEVLDEHIAKENGQKGIDMLINSARKFAILSSNIYGVDLDEEAVEIAQLNLLLKALEQRERLPNLSHNIECGNSLISGIGAELKKYFGEGYKEKKPFNWQEKFPDVFKDGGFDVIIGNPPYIQSRNLNDKERHFYWDNYLTDTNHSDIYSFFIERSIDLLRDNGILGFIVPNTWLQTPSFKSLRKKIFTECKLLKILSFSEGVKIFETAQVLNVVLILQKTTDKNLIITNSINVENQKVDNSIVLSNKIKQGSVEIEKGFNILVDLKSKNILDKVAGKSINLDLICKIIGGLRTGDDGKFLKNKSDDKNDRKLLRGRNIGRYYSKWEDEYVWYRPDLMKVKQAAAPKEAKFFESKEKLLIRMISGYEVIATYDDRQFYLLQDNLILPGHEYSIKYLLANLNSKLSSFIVKNVASNIAITQALLKKLPIYKINFSDKKEKQNYDELIGLADEILSLNKDLQKLDSILDEEEYKELKVKIDKIDKEIDEKVYELYGLTPEEIKIVEGD